MSPDRNSIADAVDRFASITVLVVGDVMLDRFIHGALDRISPEAPIPVLQARGEETMLGGAGNVVANIASLGGNARLCAVIGDDAPGNAVLGLLSAGAVEASGVLRSATRRTSCKSRYIAQNQQVLRFDEEDTTPLAKDDRAALLDTVRAMATAADIVILSDYGKGVLNHGLAAEIIAICAEAGRPVLVDPKDPNYAAYRGAAGVTPNRVELGQAVARQVSTDDEVEEACRELIAAHGFDFVLATRSEKGMSVVSADAACHVPAEKREVFDVSGAGDTVIASFALAVAAGLERADAARLSNAAAGVVVGKRGTARVSRAELLERLGATPAVPQAGPVARKDLVHMVEDWRRAGLSVGFTNGCFDILHAGHVSLLQQARAECDRLVVGLNSDGSVKRLKGDERPVNGEDDRAAVLCALRPVDAVVVFEEDTPLELIAAIRPDVLVKGAEYTVDRIVGADIVTAGGGRVVTARMVDGRSTTSAISRIRALG